VVAACRSCKSDVAEGARFCPQCGAPQSPAPAEAQAPVRASRLLARASAPAQAPERPEAPVQPAPVTIADLPGLVARRTRPARTAAAPPADETPAGEPFADLLSPEPRPITTRRGWSPFARGATR
jgi:hypothetical protein